MKLFIDGDILKYRCGFAAEKTYYLSEYPDGSYALFDTAKEAKAAIERRGGEYVWSRKEIQPLEFALQATKTVLNGIVDRFRVTSEDEMRVYLSNDKPTFRHELAVTKPYKGNRDGLHRPVHLAEIERYLIEQWGAEYAPVRIEADDSLGMALTASPDDGVVVTIDKDLDQVPGWHYNWVTGDHYCVDRRTGAFNLYTQILTGDNTDNVPGLEGVGPVKAKAILEGARSNRDLFERAWGAYRDRGKSFEYFLEQANLVYILRTREDEFLESHCPEDFDILFDWSAIAVH